MFRGYGSVFPNVLIESKNIKLLKNNSTDNDSLSERSLINDESDILLNCLITRAARHVNRHVRESVYEFIRILCDPLLLISADELLKKDEMNDNRNSRNDVKSFDDNCHNNNNKIGTINFSNINRNSKNNSSSSSSSSSGGQISDNHNAVMEENSKNRKTDDKINKNDEKTEILKMLKK